MKLMGQMTAMGQIMLDENKTTKSVNSERCSAVTNITYRRFENLLFLKSVKKQW